MSLSLTHAQVKKHQSCLSIILPARKRMNAADARVFGATYGDILWMASAVAMDDEAIARRLTEYVNDCAKRVLHIWENFADYDHRPRQSIQATDDWLDGKINEDEWKMLSWASWASGAAIRAWGERKYPNSRAHFDAHHLWFGHHARLAWDDCALRAVFGQWQFDRLVYWLAEAEPVRLPMPEHQKDVEGFNA